MNITSVEVATFLCAFARITSFFSTMPFIGDKGVPPKFRVAAAALLAMAVTPGRTPVELSSLYLKIPLELMLGVGAGFAIRLAISGAEAGGQLMGLQLQLGFAGTFDPMLREEALPTRRIAFALAGVAFLSTGGLEAALRVVLRPLHWTPSLATLPALIDASGGVMIEGIRMVAPLLCAAVIGNLAMALASRAAPALNVFSMTLAGLLTIGAIILIATAPAFAGELSDVARRAAASPLALFLR